MWRFGRDGAWHLGVTALVHAVVGHDCMVCSFGVGGGALAVRVNII